MDLYHHSVEIILQNQAPSGAYIASPNFPPYQYSWFRDGAFIAYAMDLAGQPESAARFHDWASAAVLRREPIVRRAIAKAAAGLPLGSGDILHTRYTLDGQDAAGLVWANFQLDGFGTWLWALAQHLALTGQPVPGAWVQAAGLTAAYLEALWPLPCFDLWEENPGQVHPYSLAAVWAGLVACSQVDGRDRLRLCEAIRARVLREGVAGGCFVKSVGLEVVDASLIGLGVPYHLVDPSDPRLSETVRLIELTLVRGGGVHRYAADTYYGGGEWILLAAWLGWHYAVTGSRARAAELLAWIEAQAGPEGELPEQVPLSLNDPSYFPAWVDLWGPIARPLLWSHAGYIVLKQRLGM